MNRLESIAVNGRDYAFPRKPVVVVCIDGSEPEYHQRAIEAKMMPCFERLMKDYTYMTADSAMPSFTNPNNLSIATGVPPEVHGVCGNYFYDRESGNEVMMNDPRFLRVPTLFSTFEQAGARVAVVTAKDKLHRLLSKGLSSSIHFSAEKADHATKDANGIGDVLELVGRPLPSVYSSELSEFVMAAGEKIIKDFRPDLMYLTLTDYVQHKFPPGSKEANDFYAMLDGYFEALDSLGVVLVITSDHGMNAKSGWSGRPNVVYLQDFIDEHVGEDCANVILPITDPYTVHHAALGSFAFIYANGSTDVETLARHIRELDGISAVVHHAEACEEFELPRDRAGDLAVIAESNYALGTSVHRHDLGELDRPLRSHGGLTEQQVPFLVNRPIEPLPDSHHLRNFDAYWVGLNRVVHN